MGDEAPPFHHYPRTARSSFDLLMQMGQCRLWPYFGINLAHFFVAKDINTIQPKVEPIGADGEESRVEVFALHARDLAKETQGQMQVLFGHGPPTRDPRLKACQPGADIFG